jgi:transcriptional regulator with XRE-family HTH domain
MMKPDPNVPEGYPSRVRAIRARLGLTQLQLGKRINVSFATVNRTDSE